MGERITSLNVTLTPSLHPHLLISSRQPRAGCDLHLSLTMPDAVFADPAELADQWGAQAASSRPKGAPWRWAIAPLEIDIERPFVAGGRWTVALSKATDGDEVAVDIPLHARYLPPTENGGWDIAVFGKPRHGGGPGIASGEGGSVHGAWGCGSNPKTLWPVDVELGLRLPAARPSYQVAVEATTAAVVLAGAAWIGYKIFGVWRRGTREVRMKTE